MAMSEEISGVVLGIGAGELNGKVLVCHCYPQRCHGDCLASAANDALASDTH